MDQFVKNKILSDLLSGTLVAIFSCYLNHPIDVVKTQMQSLNNGVKFRGTFGCLAFIYKTYGIQGFFAGLKPRLVRVILELSLFFTFYSQVQRVYVEKFRKSE